MLLIVRSKVLISAFFERYYAYQIFNGVGKAFPVTRLSQQIQHPLQIPAEDISCIIIQLLQNLTIVVHLILRPQSVVEAGDRGDPSGLFHVLLIKCRR